MLGAGRRAAALAPPLQAATAGGDPRWAPLGFWVGLASCGLEVLEADLDGTLQLWKLGQVTWTHRHRPLMFFSWAEIGICFNTQEPASSQHVAGFAF